MVIAAWTLVLTLGGGQYSDEPNPRFRLSLEKDPPSSKFQNLAVIRDGGSRNELVSRLQPRIWLAEWLKSDAFWGGRKQAEHVRAVVARGGHLHATFEESVQMTHGYLVRVKFYDGRAKDPDALADVAFAWNQSQPGTWSEFSRLRPAGELFAPGRMFGHDSSNLYVIGEKAIYRAFGNPARKIWVANLPLVSAERVWTFHPSSSCALLMLPGGVGEDPVYAHFDPKHGAVRIAKTPEPYGDLPQPPAWERLNRSELKTSRYTPRVLWRQMVDRAVTLESAGPFLAIHSGNTLVIDPETGRTVLRLRRMHTVKSDGRTILTVWTGPDEWPYPKSSQVEGWNAATGRRLFRFEVPGAVLITEPSSLNFFMYSNDGVSRVRLPGGKIEQQRKTGETVDLDFRFTFLAGAEYVYGIGQNGVFALHRSDLNRGKALLGPLRPAAVGDGRVVLASNYLDGVGSMADDGSDYRPFPPQFNCGQATPVVLDGRAYVSGMLLKADTREQLGDFLFCLDIHTGKLLWKKPMLFAQVAPMNSRIAILRGVYHTDQSVFSLEIRDAKTGVLEWRTNIPAPLWTVPMATVKGIVFTVRNRILTARR